MRKLCFAPLAVCGMLLGLALRLPAQVPLVDEITRQKISLPLKQPSTDDYLLQMARAAHVNLLADATNFPEATPSLVGEWNFPSSTASAGQWTGSLGNLLRELANERKLTWQRLHLKTFLFWSEPDMAELGRALATATPLPTPFAAGAFGGIRPISRAMDEALRDYLAEAHNWKLDAGGTVAQAAYKDPNIAPLRLGDLPAPLRDQLLDYCRAPMLRFLTQGENRFWFSDKFWKGARLQAFRLPADGKLRVRIVGLADRDEKNALYISNGLPLPNNAN